MTEIFLDVWNDLREKRLWPVAVLLLLGLLVVPIALSRGSGEEASAPLQVPQASPTKRGPTVQAAGAKGSSKLDEFNSKDPFRPGVEASAGEGTAVGGGGQAVVSGGAGGATPPAGPGGEGAPGGASGAETPSGGKPTAPAVPPEDTPAPTKRRSKLFSYVVDVDFGPSGRQRNRRNVKRLSILPDVKRPLLVFLGVTADAKRAVFLADSTVSQSGEGRCRPDVRTCTFIYLSTEAEHNEHFITDAQGNEYGLTLLRIKELEIKPKKARKSRAARRRHARTVERRRRRQARAGVKSVFQLPLFVDGRR